MAHFMEVDGNYINLDHVERIWVNRKTGNTTVHFKDKDRAEVFPGSHLPSTDPVVPANPGFFLLRCQYDENGKLFDEVERLPIVAWKYDAFSGEAEPVIYEQDSPMINEVGSAILSPDGQVIDPYDARWENEAAWLKEMKKEAPRQKARREELEAKQAKKVAS